METDHLAQIIAWIKAGKLAEARQALRQLLQENPRDERAWLWLAETMPDNDRRIAVLEHALKFHPEGELLRRSLAHLKIQQFSQSASPAEPAAGKEIDRTLPLQDLGTAPHEPTAAPPTSSVEPPVTEFPSKPDLDQPEPAADMGTQPAPALENQTQPEPGIPSISQVETEAPKPPTLPKDAVKRSKGRSFEIFFALLVLVVLASIAAYVFWQRKLAQERAVLLEATRAALLNTQAALQTSLAQPSPSPTATELPVTVDTPAPTSASTPMPAAYPTAAKPASAWRQAFIAVAVLDGELNIWRNDRPASFLADLGDPTYKAWGLSPDGQVVLYMHEKDLWGINSDGNGQRPLLSFSQLQGLAPLDPGQERLISQSDWIPATHQLLFTTQTSLEDGSQTPQDDLYRLDTDTGKVSQVLPAGEGGRFLISPDGTRLAFIYNDHLSLALINGGEPHGPFSWTPIPSQAGVTFYPDVAWEADGLSLLVVIPIPEAAITANPTDYAIWRILMEGPEAMQIGSVPVGAGLSHVSFSPDGRLLAFRSSSPGVYIALSDGSPVAFYPGALPLDEEREVLVAWSPDGQRLLFRQEMDVGVVYMVAGASLEPQPVFLAGAPLTQAQVSQVGWLDAHTIYYREASGNQVNWLDLDNGESGKLMQSDDPQPVIRLLAP